MPDPQRLVTFEGKTQAFPPDATDAEISAALNAIPGPNAANVPKASTWWDLHPKTTQVVKGALNTLPAAGAMAGGAPGVLSFAAAPFDAGVSVPVSAAATAGGAALGAGVGRGARDLIAESIGIEDPTSPLSKAARIGLDSLIQATLPAVFNRAKEALAEPKATLADVLESIGHPGKKLDEIVSMLRASPKVLAPAEFPPTSVLANSAEEAGPLSSQYYSQPTATPAATPVQPVAPATSGMTPDDLRVFNGLRAQGLSDAEAVTRMRAASAVGAKIGQKPLIQLGEITKMSKPDAVKYLTDRGASLAEATRYVSNARARAGL